jgi:hypothetical protein
VSTDPAEIAKRRSTDPAEILLQLGSKAQMAKPWEQDLQQEQLRLRAAVEADDQVSYAKSDAEKQGARDLYDKHHMMNSEHDHCQEFPLYYDYDLNTKSYRCLLCKKYVNHVHLNSEKHRSRFEYCTEHGWKHDRKMPLPRRPEDKAKHREAREDAPKPSLGLQLFTRTVMERKLSRGVISKDELVRHYPAGPRPNREGQEFCLGDYVTLVDLKQHPSFENAVGMVTGYNEDDARYDLSLAGKVKGFYLSQVKPCNMRLIEDDETWQQLYKEDDKLADDIAPDAAPDSDAAEHTAKLSLSTVFCE